MLITKSPEIMTFKERNREKTNLVMMWLLEFRVSSLEILSARIGLPSTATTRFFKALLSKGLIERIKVSGCDKRDLVILGPKGHRMLDTSKIASAAEIRRVRKYTKKQTISHDLETQKAALVMLCDALEIVSDFNVKIEEKKPDLLVFRWKPEEKRVLKIAVELEKTAKGSKAIYFMLNTYLKIIDKKGVDSVQFFFSHEDDLKTYVRYFEKEMWPQLVSKAFKGKLVPSTIMLNIKKDDPRRRLFSFELLDINSPPAIVPMDSTRMMDRSFKLPYLERLKEEEYEKASHQALKKREIKEKEEEEERISAQYAEEEERNGMQEKIENRRAKIASLKASISKAKAEDNAPKAWLPGYKFQSEAAMLKLIEYLDEQIRIEDNITIAAYNL